MKLKTVFLGLFAVALLAMPALAKDTPAKDSKAAPDAAASITSEPWTVRCSTDEKGKEITPRQCEVFQRLVMEKTKQRVAEIAIAIPAKPGDKTQGVIIFPLGILLTEESAIQIDDGKKFKFQIHHCTNDGCFALIDVNKNLIESMSKGTTLSMISKALNGQDLVIKLTLAGFAQAYSQTKNP